MAETNDRKFKILGAGWLGLGGLAFAFAFITLFPLAQGNFPSATQVSDGYWVFVALGLVFGAIGTVNGLALLRRIPAVRPLLAISSITLLPSATLVFPLLVVLPSLWLTLFTDGKKAFGSYMARGIDEKVASGQVQTTGVPDRAESV